MGTQHDEDAGSLAVAEDDYFQSIHDVRFITVNRVGQRYEAEVILSGEPEVDEARIQEALDVGRAHGVHAYARKHGHYGSILIFFTPDTAASA